MTRWLTGLLLAAIVALGWQTLRLERTETRVAQAETRAAVALADLADTKTAYAQERAGTERAMRELGNAMAAQSERVADETDKKLAAERARSVRAERAVAGLRDEIARLNARPAPEDSRAAALAGEARVARELLGACAAEYQWLAGEADGLRIQVAGLQDRAASVEGLLR